MLFALRAENAPELLPTCAVARCLAKNVLREIACEARPLHYKCTQILVHIDHTQLFRAFLIFFGTAKIINRATQLKTILPIVLAIETIVFF